MLTAMPFLIKRQEGIQSLLSGSDARWIKKHGRSFFGYKNHVNADARHKLIRYYAGQELDGLLHKGNTCNDVFADSASRPPAWRRKKRPAFIKSAPACGLRQSRNHHQANSGCMRPELGRVLQ